MTREIIVYKCGSREEKTYASMSVSLRTPSANGCGEAASVVAFVGAADIGSTGLKGFQGLDGQWKGLSMTEPAAEATSGEADGLETVVSSSEDSSLVEALEAGAEDGGEAEEGTSNRRFLSGDQPGGRRLVNS